MAKKTATTKASAKKSPTKAVAKKNISKGDSYACGVCGLAITVDNPCDCGPACNITCCGEPLKKVTRAKACRK